MSQARTYLLLIQTGNLFIMLCVCNCKLVLFSIFVAGAETLVCSLQLDISWLICRRITVGQMLLVSKDY